MSAPTPTTIKAACEKLSACNGALARAYGDIGVPEWRASDPCFAALARMIAYQQISTKAGAAIWGRVEQAAPDMVCDAILAVDDTVLRACGLSNSKVRYIKAIAEAEATGALNFAQLPTISPDEARSQLVAVKGIGPWTADLFLLYCGQMDAFPPGDVGLMESYRLLSEHEDRMESKAFTALSEDWRPWRGVAVHLLWGWINAMRENNNQPPT